MTTKGWVNISFMALGAGIALLVSLFLNQCQRPRPQIGITVQDSTQHFRDEKNREVAAVKKEAQDFYRVMEAGYLDSIAKLHDTKAKLLLEVATLKQHGVVTITNSTGPVIKFDTVPGECPKAMWAQEMFTNPYYSATVLLSLEGEDTSRLDLQTFDTLSMVSKFVNEGNIFNRKTYLQVDAVNANPYNHITGLQVYRQPLPKPKKFGIGIFAGYGIGGASFKPGVMIGAGIQYNFIRL